MGLRVVYLLTRAAVIDNEGALYGMMANDLLSLRAFPATPTGIQPQLVMGWFYPAMIAGMTLVTRDTELAARLVSLIAGTSLIPTLFYLALRLYDRRTAWIAAVLAATFPILVAFSATCYSETLYMALLMAGVYWSIRCFDSDRGKAWILASAFLGCAYLTRPEALVLPPIIVLFMLGNAYLQRLDRGAALRASAGLLLVFALFVLPLVVLLKIYTGHFLLEGKSRLNYTIGQRVLTGMPPGQAARGIDENLRVVGPQLAQLENVARSPYPTTPAYLLQYFLKMSWRNKGWILNELLPSLVYGSLLLPVLVAMGLFHESWDANRLYREGFLLVIVLFQLFVLLSVHIRLFRYSLALLPFGLLWAARGLTALGGWAQRTVLSLSSRLDSVAAVTSSVFIGVPLILLLGLSVTGLDYVSELNESLPDRHILKEAGLRLRRESGAHPVVMSHDAIIPFYAGADWRPLPYADASLTLRYVAATHPDIVAISYLAAGMTPYADDWLKSGIADPRALPIFESVDARGRGIRTYRWINIEAESTGLCLVSGQDRASVTPDKPNQ